MISASIVHDDNFVARGVEPKGPLPALHILLKTRDGHCPYDSSATAPGNDLNDAAAKFDPGRLADEFDGAAGVITHTVPLLLNTSEREGKGAAANDSGKHLISINVPFLPTVAISRQTVVRFPTRGAAA